MITNFLDFLLFLDEEHQRYLNIVDGRIANRTAIYKLDGIKTEAGKEKWIKDNFNDPKCCFRKLEYYNFIFDIKDDTLVCAFNSVIKPFEYLRLFQYKFVNAMNEIYEFYRNESENKVEVTYVLKEVLNNPYRLKAFLNKDEYENKIPKSVQKFYRKS